MRRESAILGLCALVMPVGAALAHTMWLTTAFDDLEQQVVVSVSYGDFLPGSELLTPEWGAMKLHGYDLVAPDGTRHALGIPELVERAARDASNGVTVADGGDVGMRRIAYAGATLKGTYQVAAESPVFRYVKYLGNHGKPRYTNRPASELAGAKILDASTMEAFYLKTAFTVGGWTDAAPLGQLLEIVPLSDLSELRAGDEVRFKVLFKGKAWRPSGGQPLTAANAALGDRWGIAAPVRHGEAVFRVPHAGHWRIDVHDMGTVADFSSGTPGTEGMAGHAAVYINSSFMLYVRP